MFTYIDPQTQKERTLDIKVTECIRARYVEKLSWRDIGEMERATRIDRFGYHCHMDNLRRIRVTEEFATEARTFAETGNYSVNHVLQVVMARKYRLNGKHASSEPPKAVVKAPPILAVETPSDRAANLLMRTVKQLYSGKALNENQRMAIRMLELDSLLDAVMRENKALAAENRQLSAELLALQNERHAASTAA